MQYPGRLKSNAFTSEPDELSEHWLAACHERPALTDAAAAVGCVGSLLGVFHCPAAISQRQCVAISGGDIGGSARLVLDNERLAEPFRYQARGTQSARALTRGHPVVGRRQDGAFAENFAVKQLTQRLGHLCRKREQKTGGEQPLHFITANPLMQQRPSANGDHP